MATNKITVPTKRGKCTFISRHDDYTEDSIAWAFETHVKQPDDPTIVCALVYGNEDCPESIEFYTVNDYRAKPKTVWYPKVTK